MVGVYEVGKWGWVARSSPTDRTKNKQLSIHVISDGITRLPILEGEISHIEIPRRHPALGLTIVGGADTPLRCVVVQEVFPDGLVAQDGRLQPGDQIIEVDGVDMTSATHQAVCQALRRPNAVLRLGVYRERIEAYRTSPHAGHDDLHGTPVEGEMMAVTLHKESNRQLGLKLGGRRTEPGIFVMEVLEGSVAAQDGRLHPHDRILAINGADVRYARLDHASTLIHESQNRVSLVVRRGPGPAAFEYSSRATVSSPECPPHAWRRSPSENGSQGSHGDEPSVSEGGCGGGPLQYGRSASCDSLSDHSLVSSMLSSPSTGLPSDAGGGTSSPPRGGSPITSSPSYCTSDTDDVEIHPHQATSDPHYQGHHHPHQPGVSPPADHTIHHTTSISLPVTPRGGQAPEDTHDFAAGLRRLLHSENNHLQQKNVTIKKATRESLGMRIGGGLGSNEGDTPIYIANINPQGPVGRRRNVKKGDVVLSVNGQSLVGLTHGQAVALLKATAELAGVTLSLLDGPETSLGSANFVPSWLFWQKLPRSLHVSKSVVLHRAPGASLGFSIVGGADPQRGTEPIHVLFVVQSSPAAADGKLRCGDRLLAVDGHSLELVRHAAAVALLKQAGQRVHLQVVSWLGTEL
ncbi:ligand of Numb protein X 2-like isoform X2 [Scylla paramamosain]|uniref:ligand of Numb protein X 2-like isoform X2 n=1 Tax=Scylla paramamosain TaxID=85552 RepID=UPI0030831C74